MNRWRFVVGVVIIFYSFLNFGMLYGENYICWIDCGFECVCFGEFVFYF